VLYHVGHADQSFATWLGRNSHRVEALTLSDIQSNLLSSDNPILPALGSAAAAALAAGRPLPLHTLRALQGYIRMDAICRLLAVLPRLRCLQLKACELDSCAPVYEPLQPLTALQGATQLEELYLQGPYPSHPSLEAHLAGMLPVGLKRLGWDPVRFLMNPDLSHLTQVTFLQLTGWTWTSRHYSGGFTSSQLPPSLQQLELKEVRDVMELVEEQQQTVTAWDMDYLAYGDWHHQQQQNQLGRLPNLHAVSVHAKQLDSPAAQGALEQVPQLSALTVHCFGHELRGMHAGLATAARLISLRRLHLRLTDLPAPADLGALSEWQKQAHVTQLRLCVAAPARCTLRQQQQQQAWGVVVGCFPRLRWLSMPDVLLGAGSGWLGGMQQLRVLVVRCTEVECSAHASSMHWEWLEGCTREALPPRLQVLGVSGITAQQAASVRLRRRLQQELAGSACEVVVGVSLDEAADPTQQLAGLPVTLQQALACA
jgi:hypothetical protein